MLEKYIAAGLSLMLLCLLFVPATALAQSADAPEAIKPSSLKWMSPPGHPDIKAAWVVGAEKKSVPYALRVQLAEDGRIPPHTHPDARYSTVLSGTLYVGFGKKMNDSEMVAIPKGAVYTVKKGVAHYLWAQDGDVTYQEGGTGPTATHFLRH